MSQNTAIVVASAIARALRHSCAPSVEQEEAAVSLRHLNGLMKANGMAYNDALPEDRQWSFSCMEGWVEEREECFTDVTLSHRTQTGRLSVKVANTEARLSFHAGPVEGAIEGRLCAELMLSYYAGKSLEVWVSSAKAELLIDRPDRLGLLISIDEELGGQLVKLLTQSRDYPSGDDSARKVITQALEAMKVAA